LIVATADEKPLIFCLGLVLNDSGCKMEEVNFFFYPISPRHLMARVSPQCNRNELAKKKIK
jgi:hypothetical protein